MRIAGDEATVEDLGSKNGTFVADRRLDSPKPVTVRRRCQNSSGSHARSPGRAISRPRAQRTPGVVLRQPDYFLALDAILANTPLAVLQQYLRSACWTTYQTQSAVPRCQVLVPRLCSTSSRLSLRSTLRRNSNERVGRWRSVARAFRSAPRANKPVYARRFPPSPRRGA